MAISGEQEKALSQVLVNYVNDDDTASWDVIEAIKGILHCDGEATLRDEFAMAALSGLLADPNVIAKGIAKTSYEIADDMLKARK